MQDTVQPIERKKRSFLPENFEVKDWESLKPYYTQLLDRSIDNVDELRQWFIDRSELEAALSEDLGWRYIRMTCDTTDEQLTEAYTYFVTQISPETEPYNHQLNEKAIASPFLAGIKEEGYEIMIRSMRKHIELFREENIPLKAELSKESQRFGSINGAMSIDHDGQELTMQQAGSLLQEPNRALREEIYHKMGTRRLQDKDALNALFNTLISLRTQVAQNADYKNYRDYKFDELGRFDYSPQDCFDFHESVKTEVVPLLDGFARERKQKLGVDSLRPYDKAVDPENKPPLKPFGTGEELLDKSIEVFDRIDSYLGQCLRTMKAMGHLDLVSRKGKAPGGYNYPLSEIGVPFIFMNATSTLRDLVTLMHEGGHAIHSFLTRDLEIVDFKHTPSEVAELASMSMELISMDHWDVFFEDEEELKRAKREHLEQIVDTLPWVATIDKFQHWIYENPEHTVAEREEAWLGIYTAFTDEQTDWSGLEENRRNLWQRQLHLYEVPFYYIEYGFAQLGALAVWKNYKENPAKGLEAYLNALRLGYKRSIPEVYEAADIRFDFSKEYIRDLIAFLKEELDKV